MEGYFTFKTTGSGIVYTVKNKGYKDKYIPQQLRDPSVCLQNWKLCVSGLIDSALKLDEIKARLKSPLPEKIEDLKKHEQLTKVIIYVMKLIHKQ